MEISIMKTNKWILGGLMAMAITACTSDELVENTNPTLGKEVTVTAYAPGDKANSRVSFADDNTSKVTLSWKDTENFSVVYHTTAQTFSKTTAGNTFTGILPYDNENNESNYYAVYPALSANTSLTTANTVPFDLSTQTGALDESKTYMRASSSNGLSYSFQHCTAILKATFANIPEGAKISQVVVKTSHADSKVDGNLNLTDGTISSGSKNTITINYTTAVDASTPVYIYLPPMAAAKKALEFEVSTTDDKTYTGTLGAANTPEPSDVESSNANQGQGIVAGKLYTATIALTEVPEVNYVWTSGIVASASVEGDGTEESPYLIHSANDLQWMIDQVNNVAPQPSPIDESENSTPQLPYYRLTHDLEIDSEEGATWTPIGTSSSPFVGYFDGGGWTISGEMHTTTDLVGFFGYNAGAISNLKNTAEVKDCRTLMPASIEYSAIGSIAGYSKGKIIHCENSGNVTAPSIFTTTYTGGICGYQCRDNDETIALITECKNSGDVTGVAGDGNATGGIVGRSDGCTFYALIMACENAGSVTTGDKIGGICGLAEGPTAIVACLNTGDAGVGGIFGGDENYDLNGCCTTKGYIGSEVDSEFFYACYTFDVNYEGTEEYVDYSEREWVEEIVGPCNDPTNIGHDEMNYAIVQMNFFSLGEYPCNWHWEVGENNIPKLVEGEPLGRPGA